MDEPKIPSVILFLKKATTKISDKTGKLWGLLSLEAEINDEAIWKGVEANFRTGMKIYAEENFQMQIIEALRQENVSLRTRTILLEDERDELLDDNQSLKAALSIMASSIGEKT